MSGLFDAIGRGISAAANHASDIWARQSVLEKQGEAEMERLQRLEEWKAQREEESGKRKSAAEDTKRKSMMSEIDQRAGLMAAQDTGVSETRNEIEAGIADRGSWTPEQQAAADQALGKPFVEAKRGRRIDAAADLGHIPVKSLFDAESQIKLEQERTAREELKEEGRNKREELKEEGRDAREEKRQQRNGKSPEAENIRDQIKALESKRLAISNRATEKRKLYEQEMDAADRLEEPKVRQKYEPLMKQLDEQRDKLDADLDRLFERLEKSVTAPNIKTTEAPKLGSRDAPAASRPAARGLPPGWSVKVR